MTSLNDTTLTKVTYGKYATRVPDEVANGIYKWFSSQLNTLHHVIKWYLNAYQSKAAKQFSVVFFLGGGLVITERAGLRG